MFYKKKMFKYIFYFIIFVKVEDNHFKADFSEHFNCLTLNIH